MNAQEIYNKVAVHLLTQNAKSQTGRFDEMGKPICAYRGPEDRMCAAGCLLTDEEAEGLDEGSGKCWRAVKRRLDLPRFQGHTDLIGDLQSLHDCNEVDQWGVELAKLAEKHGLSTEVLR